MVDLGLGVMSISGLKPTLGAAGRERGLKINGAQGMSLTRIGVAGEYRLTPERWRVLWPASRAATAPRSSTSTRPYPRSRWLFGVAYRL